MALRTSGQKSKGGYIMKKKVLIIEITVSLFAFFVIGCQRAPHASFDMSKSIKLKKPIIEPKDIQINLEHSQNLASINIHAKKPKRSFCLCCKTF